MVGGISGQSHADNGKDPAYELLLSCPRGFTGSQLKVDFSSKYDRVPHPVPELEQSIGKIWEDRLAGNPSLFNATKFRYGGYKTLDMGSNESDTANICLCLGLTDYKTFVGTNLSNNWGAFLSKGGDDVERCQYTASPLGNGAVVETTDNFILLLKRSQHVGEFPGHLVFPGGHSEPQEIGINGHDASSAHNHESLNAIISKEMFDGITREVIEETGVPSASLSDPLFLGISRRKLNVRPTAFFYVKCHMSSSEVLQYYKHAQHSFESVELVCISKEDLIPAAERMPGCHQGGAALYKIFEKSNHGMDQIY